MVFEQQVCTPNDTYLFFEQANNGRYRYKEKAKSLCETCAAIHECADFSLLYSPNETKGMLAGMGEPERRSLLIARERHEPYFHSVVASSIRGVAELVEQETMCRVQRVLSAR